MPKKAEDRTTNDSTPKKASSSSSARTKTVAAKKTIRKAPPRFSQESEKSRSSKMPYAIALAVIAVVGVSVYIGTSDKGQINVTATISQRASMQEASGDIEGSEATKAIKVQSPTDQSSSNGGLVGHGNKETEQQKIEARNRAISASTTDSNTDQTASSTESGATDEETNGQTEDGTESESNNTEEEGDPSTLEDTTNQTE